VVAGAVGDRLAGLVRGRRRRLLLAGVGALAVCGLAVGLLLGLGGSGGGRAGGAARPPVVTVAERPAALDRAGALAVWNKARGSAGLTSLTEVSCLDDLAARYAAAAGDAPVGAVAPTPTLAPQVGPGGCSGAGLRVGWVAGADPSGLAQAAALLGRTPDGRSPIAAKDARWVGLALVQRRVDGKLTGFLLAWAVAQ